MTQKVVIHENVNDLLWTCVVWFLRVQKWREEVGSKFEESPLELCQVEKDWRRNRYIDCGMEKCNLHQLNGLNCGVSPEERYGVEDEYENNRKSGGYICCRFLPLGRWIVLNLLYNKVSLGNLQSCPSIRRHNGRRICDFNRKLGIIQSLFNDQIEFNRLIRQYLISVGNTIIDQTRHIEQSSLHLQLNFENILNLLIDIHSLIELQVNDILVIFYCHTGSEI